MNLKIVNSLKILLFFLAFLQFSFAQSTHYRHEKIDSIFSDYTQNVPGVSIAVVKNGEIIFSKAYGSANLEYHIPNTNKTVFNIGSVSKQFVAFAAYLLDKEGKLSLNENVHKYFPELPYYFKKIKIRHLLSHTSGLRDQWSLLTLAGWRMDDVITTEQILNLVKRQKSLNFSPGEKFQYNNTGYTLMVEIIKKVTGKSFPEFMKERIFTPLKMNNSEFIDNYEKLIENRAYSYYHNGNEWRKMKLNYLTLGPTGLHTNTEDLAKWVTNFYYPTVGNKKLFKDFDTISRLNDGNPVVWSVFGNDSIYHAKGQLVYNYQGVDLISHGGHDGGFRATLTRFPEENLSVIALSNNEHYNMFDNLIAIANVFLQKKFQPSTSEDSTVSEKIAPVSNDTKTDQREYVGNYNSDELDTFYEVYLKGDSLIMNHNRLGHIPMKRIEPNTYTGVNSFPFTLKFVPSRDGILGFNISNFGIQKMFFKKVYREYENRVTEVVDIQLEAYNDGNIEDFLRTYADDAVLLDYDKKVLGQGKKYLRKKYTSLFKKSPELHGEVTNRIVIGNKVIDQEQVTGIKGIPILRTVAVYSIENNKISNVTFIKE